jgi:methionyl-tRNA formyltransferase
MYRIVFMGTPAPAAATLESLLRGPDHVVGVVTQPDRPVGRGQKTLPSPVRILARDRGIPVLAPQKMKDPGLLEQLRGWAPDVIAVVAYGRILPQVILDLPSKGCINVHYSLLPRHRGAAPMQWALLNGDSVTGVTTMLLVARMDAGPVLLQEKVPIDPWDTTVTLQEKLVPVGAELLLKTIVRLKDGTVTPTEQDEGAATYASMLRKEDGLIDWTNSALEIERRVRAFTPWPSAFTYYEGKLVKIHDARVVDARVLQDPGTIVKTSDGDLWVATGQGLLSVDVLQFEGKNRMSADVLLRSGRLEPGSCFERRQEDHTA